MFKSFWTGGVALALLASPVALAGDAADGDAADNAKPKAPQVRIEVHSGPGHVGGNLPGVPLRPIVLGDYWLGLSCFPAQGPLRTQLNLPEDRGLVVESVVPNGPAAKAGIKVHDVLLSAGDKPLGDLRDLVDAIDKAGETELSVELIRDAKKQQLKVTPGKRPEEMRGRPIVPLPRLWQHDWIENIWPENSPGGSIRYRVWHPGIILPHGAAVGVPLPGNLTVNITRHANEPAKIIVQRNGDKWELSEDDLDELPDDVRPHVSRMLGNLTAPFKRLELGPRFQFKHPAPGKRLQRKIVEELEENLAPDKQLRRLKDSLQEQIEEMDRRMEEMRKMIDEQLQEEHP